MTRIPPLSIAVLLAAFAIMPAIRAEQDNSAQARFLRERLKALEEERELRRLEKEKTKEEKKKEKEQQKTKAKEEPPKPTAWQEQLKKATALLEKDDIIGAYSAFQSLAKQDQDKEVAAQAAEKLKQMEQTGLDEVKAAMAIEDPTEAERQLSAIYRRYWRTPVKAAIAEATAQLNLRKAQRRGAEGQPATAEESAPQPEQTGTGKPEDPDMAARAWLIIGDIHRLNARPAQAEQAYRNLIYEYPDSRFVAEALNRLKEMQAEKDFDSRGEAE